LEIVEINVRENRKGSRE